MALPSVTTPRPIAYLSTNSPMRITGGGKLGSFTPAFNCCASAWGVLIQSHFPPPSVHGASFLDISEYRRHISKLSTAPVDDLRVSFGYRAPHLAQFPPSIFSRAKSRFPFVQNLKRRALWSFQTELWALLVRVTPFCLHIYHSPQVASKAGCDDWMLIVRVATLLPSDGLEREGREEQSLHHCVPEFSSSIRRGRVSTGDFYRLISLEPSFTIAFLPWAIANYGPIDCGILADDKFICASGFSA
ncbi:hypothetical protein NMY22_g3137 [Coprinellus aureogranulatus]|nr:hypothetical protein NMY22_g3137 [Coprinellus aureogranulatus]